MERENLENTDAGICIAYTITGPPVTKKNSQQILINPRTKRPFVTSSKQYKKYEAEVVKQIKPEHDPIDYPVNVKALFYMPTRRKCDLTNLEEALDDAFIKAGVIKDDNFSIVAGHDGSRVYYDKENPRTEIEITPMEI